jgi:amino acid transporter
VLLLVRAFASGCTALTGVEAISNGVPAFRKPKSRNAALTLTLMGVIAVVLFTGITLLAVRLQARAQPDGNPSVISQIAASVFGGGSALFYLFQAATAGCRGSCTIVGIGWCSPTGSCCLREWPSP